MVEVWQWIQWLHYTLKGYWVWRTTLLETGFETLHKSWSPETVDVNCFGGSLKNLSVAIWYKKCYFPPFLFVLDETYKGWDID